jgi:hypothetical protein
MRASLRYLLPLLLLGACTDRSAVAPDPDPDPKPEPKILGVYDFTIEGIGTDEITGHVTRVDDGTTLPISAALNPIGDGLYIENLSWSSASEQARGPTNAHRYISISYRVRNDVGVPLNNVTFIPLINNGTLPGTPFRVLRRFDNSGVVDQSIADRIVPTGHVMFGDGLRMISPVQDVLQVFDESEVAAIPLPVGVHSLFPYGFMVRNTSVPASRSLPPAAHSQVFDGVLTMAFRVPMPPRAGAPDVDDVFGFTVRTLAVEDTQTRLTESIEEAADTAAVRRLRARATAMGATTVTVLAGSMAASPSTPNYPGQRQLCTVRTAGTPGSPVTLITNPGPHSDFMVLRPGETMDPCAPGFKTGNAGRPATNVPMPVEIRPVDRYGNNLVVRDTVRIEIAPGSPPGTASPAVRVDNQGIAAMSVTFSDYGNAVLAVRGRRILGSENPIPVAGVVRTWTAGAGTTAWNTNENWSPAAVPMHLDSVVVPQPAPLYPVLASNVSIQGIDVGNGATVTMGPFDLTAAANVATGLSGGINSSSGRLVLTGTARLMRGNLPRTTVLGTYTLDGNVNTVATTRVQGGRIRNASFRLRTVSQ